MNFDIRIRHTIWSVAIGNYFFWLASCSVNQSMVQRFLSLPSLTKAKISVVILAGGIILIVALCCLTGLVIYATYHDCDPLAAQKIKKADQLLPFFVMEIADEIPGLPGIFLSGVFSAALSTMSTGLNSMTGVIFEDIIKSVYRKPISEIQASFIMKILVVIIGILCVAMVFIVEQLGTLVQAGKSLSGITAGPLLGVFTLGMFFPCANSKGALVGGAISLIIVAWISIGSQRQIASGKIVFSQKPVSITGCPHLSPNDTFIKLQNVKISPTDPFLLFEISYLWYTFIGMLITLIVGNIVSYITGGNNIRNLDKNLLTPLIRGCFTEKKSTTDLHQLENTYVNKRNRKT